MALKSWRSIAGDKRDFDRGHQSSNGITGHAVVWNRLDHFREKLESLVSCRQGFWFLHLTSESTNQSSTARGNSFNRASVPRILHGSELTTLTRTLVDFVHVHTRQISDKRRRGSMICSSSLVA